ncbi:hypothetical protein G6F57_007081 [Rhizopus arrhizus]|uniref:Protein kinase domain-containing protein n=1 Tax=Rhizopus oryzae TaxID=64495 RepID=A0A9P7BRR2_RHIOR|nr:hypothetical protein G6F24_005839 [Rhizopus arrhizus]KAG1421597.1 hypothetical protein G6F58_003684 [Rhizopus delemar]KAG0790151.1 hypothetical protein G6F21_006013 [Rhizopus arrhizus]KAG0810522.1 hypothetical protein G6F20_007897 [Rhizopus arrhizus]KAG0826923.1 hypothetical protein G6F18_009717 [Rhizopus arrhizus]
MYNNNTIHDEEEVKQFISNTLKLELPNGPLQDILKDGILLCDLIKVFSPDGCIMKNDGRTKFAYQDNIGQFLREAERLHIPQSDLFQTVDLLEGKRMQSVITCLLAIQRIMRDRKLIPDTTRPKKKSNNLLFSTTKAPSGINRLIQNKQEPLDTVFRKIMNGPQLKYVITQALPPSPSTPPTLAPNTRRYSSAATQVTLSVSNDQPKPSKSTSIAEQVIANNRKASLKKMGSCAIKVYDEDGSQSIYALGKSIGKGQFGEVFGGLNMDTGEYVAIKRIKRTEMNCDDMNEVDLLKHLNHEHIVRYKGFSKDNIYINIILEYVEMGSLLHNIKAFGKFPEKLAASYTYKILSGLHYLHSQQVIHCDLKAANILTTKTGSLKLTDFGVSLNMKMKDDETTGEPAGTPNWMAPEIIKLAGASTKSDIWSLGCTIVEMLTGKPPYADMHSFAALYKIVEDEEPPIPKSLKLSAEAEEFLLSCFRKNPDDRPSANELMRYKWMKPFFQKDKSLSVNCSHKNNPIKNYLQVFHVKYISNDWEKSSKKSYAPLPPLPPLSSSHDQPIYYLPATEHGPEGVSNTRKGFNMPSSIMTQ